MNIKENNFYILGLIWNFSKPRVFFALISKIIEYCFFGLFYPLVFFRFLFNISTDRTYPQTLLFIVIVVALALPMTAFQSWYKNRYLSVNDIKLYYSINKKLFDKANSVDVSCYENAEFYNSYTKAASQMFEKSKDVLDQSCQCIVSLISSVIVISYMVSVNLGIVFFVVFQFLCSFPMDTILNKYVFEKDMRSVDFKRRKDYTKRAVYLQKYAKEIRTSNIFSVLASMYDDAFKGMIKVIKKYIKKILVLRTIKEVILYPITFYGGWLYAAYLVMVDKSINVGDFIILCTGITLSTFMLSFFAGSLVQFYNNSLYIDKIKEFLNFEAKIPEAQDGITLEAPIDSIELKNVSFKYDGEEQFCLKNVSMRIHTGMKVSLVGHNGAGKSTLVKLIMRLYDPTEGEILLNGVNIKEYNLKEYRKLIGTAFQDFQMFSVSVLENVLMGTIEGNEDRERAVNALHKANIYEKVSTLENKEDTILTREFDENGTALSVGEYQKVAISRVFAKNAPILILDEPSSALDPIAESQMYKTILQVCDNTENEKQKKMAFIISHRLSLATMTDYIYYLENGSILEEGGHSQLMDKQGLYAETFLKQAENYMEEVMY